ncbi:MAG: O-antigen ligase family protein [Candidatus Dormibacteria bacterium]
MSEPQGELAWERLEAAGLLVAVVLVPLLFSVSVSDHFALPKVVALHLGAGLCLAGWAGHCLTTRRPRLGRLQALALAAWLAVVAGSTVASVDPRVSALGLAGRFEGLSTQLCFGVLVVSSAGPAFRRRPRTWLGVVAATAAAASIYGLVQRFGLDPIDWVVDIPGRAASTLGNPIVLAGYLDLTIPATVALALLTRGLSRFGAGAALVLQLAALTATYSRGGWFGAVAGAGVFILLGHRRALQAWGARGLALAAGVAALGLAGLVLLPGTGPLGVPERLASGFDPHDVSAMARQGFLVTGLALVVERPLLGSGPDTVQEVYPERRGALEAVTAPNTVVTKLHDEYLQVAATSGLIGLAAWLLLLAALLWPAFRRLWQTRAAPDWTRIGLLAGVIALLGSYVFGFSEVPLTAGLALWLGWLAGGDPARGAGTRPRRGGPRTHSVVAGVVGLLVTLVVISLDGGPLLASADLLAGRQMEQAQNWSGAAARFLEAVSLDPGVEDYQFQRGLALLEAAPAADPPGRAALLRDAAESFRAAANLTPRDPYAHAALSDALAGLAGADRRSPDWAPARREAEVSVGIDPLNPNVLVGAGQAELALGERVTALRLGRIALGLRPGYAQATALVESALGPVP